MSQEPVTVSIVGIGFRPFAASERHAKAILKSDKLKLLTCYTRSQEKRERFTKEYHCEQENSKGLIDDKTAKSSLEGALTLCNTNIKILDEDSEMILDAFEMAESNNTAIYDLLYLLVAKKNQSVLLSKDENQVKLAKKLGIAIEEI